MVVGNPIRAIIDTVRGIITAFVSDPRMTFLYTCIWAWMGLVVGLVGLGNDIGFFNILTDFFFVVAGLLLLLTLVKYALWRIRGLRESVLLPDGRIVVAFLHKGNAVAQVIVPPTKAKDLVEVVCPICRGKFLAWVDNPQARKARLRSLTLKALLTLFVGLALNVFLTSLFLGNYDAGWVFWVRLLGYFFLFANAIYVSKLVQYARVREDSISRDHSMIPLNPSLLATFHQQQAEIAHP